MQQPFIRSFCGRSLFLAPVLAVAIFSGCKKEPPPPPPPPPPAPRPKPPEPVSVDTLLQSMKADARVQFPAASAPADEGLAKAVISFADAFAKGDSEKLKPMLDPLGKKVLDQLLASGEWDESTGKKIEAVRVSKLTGSDPATLRLAIQEPGTAYALVWSVSGSDGKYTFAAQPSASVTLTRASEFDNASLPTGMEASTVTAAPTEESRPGAPGKADEPAKDDAPAKDSDAPRKRSTPNGPVTIPKPGGG